jgi:hypothetical protein
MAEPKNNEKSAQAVKLLESFVKDSKGSSPVLWCGLEVKKVLDIKKCPQGKWEKNPGGFPLPAAQIRT